MRSLLVVLLSLTLLVSRGACVAHSHADAGVIESLVHTMVPHVHRMDWMADSSVDQIGQGSHPVGRDDSATYLPSEKCLAEISSSSAEQDFEKLQALPSTELQQPLSGTPLLSQVKIGLPASCPIYLRNLSLRC